MTKEWVPADFDYAHERVEIDLPDSRQAPVASFLLKLRDERETAAAREEAETANQQRHSDLVARLEELKEPHWTAVPNFWMTLVILILTAIGAAAAVLALLRG